jgi:tetratricopeptide (TPR) repeat protein
LQQQLRVAQQLGDMAQMALAQQGIGIVMEAQGRWPEALSQFQQAYQTDVQTADHQNAVYDLLGEAGVLWQLGRYEEARQTLDGMSRDTTRTASGLAAVMRAEMALSQRQFAAAMSASRQVLTQNLSGGDLLVGAKRSLGLAQLGSGASRDGAASIADAVALAQKSGNPVIIAGAAVSGAEAALAAGSPQAALEQALSAQQWYARAGNLSVEWRCWLLAALAEKALGDAAKSREYAARAAKNLADLSAKWDSESYKTYLARPDIQFDGGRLSRLTGTP